MVIDSRGGGRMSDSVVIAAIVAIVAIVGIVALVSFHKDVSMNFRSKKSNSSSQNEIAVTAEDKYLDKDTKN